MRFLESKYVKISGYAIFIISCLLWGFLLVIPLLELTKAQLAWTTTSVFIAAEITFYLSIFLLGKSFYNKIKNKLKFWKKKEVEVESPKPEKS